LAAVLAAEPIEASWPGVRAECSWPGRARSRPSRPSWRPPWCSWPSRIEASWRPGRAGSRRAGRGPGRSRGATPGLGELGRPDVRARCSWPSRARSWPSRRPPWCSWRS